MSVDIQGAVPMIGGRNKLHVHVSAGYAFPATADVPTQDGARRTISMGLSKLEWMAAILASGKGAYFDSDLDDVVDTAARLIQICHEKQAEINQAAKSAETE